MSDDTSSDTVSSETDSSSTKWWRVTVPDYDSTTDGSQSSFLHLGASDTTVTDNANHAALTRLVTGFEDDTRSRHVDSGSSASENTGSHDRTQDERAALSAKLYTAGGWVDHTDGNRITTTGGDKVEVIWGNYRMVVLGRPTGDNDPKTNASSDYTGAVTEHGGGHSIGHDDGPADTLEIRWVERYGGTWRVTEATSNGDSYAFATGNNYEEMQGTVVEHMIGNTYGFHGPRSKMPSDWKAEQSDGKNSVPTEPSVFPTTLISDTKTYYDAEELVYANTTAKQYADTIKESKYVDTLIDEVTKIPNGTINEFVQAGSIGTALTVGARAEYTAAGEDLAVATYLAKQEMHVFTSNIELMIGVEKAEIELVAHKLDLGIHKTEVEGMEEHVKGMVNHAIGLYNAAKGANNSANGAASTANGATATVTAASTTASAATSSVAAANSTVAAANSTNAAIATTNP
jgi:hypothetical protein